MRDQPYYPYREHNHILNDVSTVDWLTSFDINAWCCDKFLQLQKNYIYTLLYS